tara:strand:- start:6174 stop:10310 length:4137 start_codon:yes stop_codon:yes gene_type:complete
MTSKYIRKTFFIAVLMIVQISISQTDFENITFNSIKENVSQRAISTILKDHKGIIWIGTQGDGLYSFNGLELKNYRYEWDDFNSLKSSVVNTVYLDSKNNLWIGTDEGLNLYSRALDQFTAVELNEMNSKIQVKAIGESEGKKLLIGTHGAGVFEVDNNTLESKSVEIKDYSNINKLQINDIKRTARGALLFGSNIGLLKYNSLNQELDYAKFTTLRQAEIIKTPIQSLLTKADGSIWLGTINQGLVEISTTPTNYFEYKTYTITSKRILSLETDSKGFIYCGTENDGLIIVDNNGEIIKSFKFNKSDIKGVKSNSIWTVFIDNANRIWLGYFNQGVDIYDKESDRFKSIESIPNKDQSLFSKSVTSIKQDKQGRFWIGISDGGVDVYDPVKETFTHLLDQSNNIAKGLKSSDVVSLFIDSKHNVWIGTWNSGLFLLKKGSKIFKNIQIKNSSNILKSNRIMSFAEDSKGRIWIGSFLTGLYSYNLQTETLIHHQSKAFKSLYINSKNIRKVIVDKQDNVWIGTRTGLFKIKDPYSENPKITGFNSVLNKTTNSRVKFNIITTIFEDQKNNIWVGTDGDGLCKLNPTTLNVKWFNSLENFDHQSIKSILQTQDGNIWLAGNNGISKFDTFSNRFTNYNTQDGLITNTFNKNSSILSEDGTLYFGCYKGINYFDPKAITTNQNPPVVYLTDFKISNQSISPSDINSPLTKVINETSKIKLAHNQSMFTIDYFGLGYTRSKNNEYAYYLEGFESDWNYVKKTRTATYTNIPPGTYNFKVKAANSDGKWSIAPRTLEIEVSPPWWQTHSAIFTFISLVLIASILVYRLLNVRIKERQQIKNEREERAQEEALNAKKIQFFTNISHEFRTPLTLILNPLEAIIENKSIALPKEIEEKHATIYKNSKRLSRLIDELMDFRKLQFNKMAINASNFELLPFVNEVASHFEEEAIQRNIIFSVDSIDPSISIWADPSMLEKVIFNLLSNAFKATKDNGIVSVKIQIPLRTVKFPLLSNQNDLHGIEICISDSGIGIDKKDLDNIFTRFYQSNEMDRQYYGGTGIGLEVVKNFIDLHKGKIEVSSEKGKGTQFKILFPEGNKHLDLSKTKSNNGDDNKKYEQINALQLEEKIKPVGNKKTILIVEDNAELRNYLKTELHEDYKVKAARNGKEGLEIAIKLIPDLIISDVMMPIMDGFEMCSKIKNDLRISHIPLLMITAKGMQIDRVKGIDSGADVYLNKPFNMNVLRSHLTQLINSRQILFNKYYNGISDEELKNTTSLDKQFITNILKYIHENINDADLNVENLADELLISRSKLYRKIKALTGNTANEFIKNIRLEKAKQLLEHSEYSISEISFKVGFSSPSYFTKCYKIHFGILPTDVRSQSN